MINIIIPLYKGRDTLPTALDSLLVQTKKMFLVSIVQDCDDENYEDIIDEYRDRGLHITHHTLKENVGPGMARQYGIDHTEMCDYVMFLDSDDMLMPTAINTLYTEVKKNGFDVIASDIMVEHKHQPNQTLNVLNTPSTWCHGKAYRLKYLQENDIRFIPELRINEDSYFNLVAVNSTKNRGKIPEVTYYWRDNENSITRAKDQNAFAKKSWPQYLYSQILGLSRIINTQDFDWHVGALTLLNAYYTHMKLSYYDASFNFENYKLLQENNGVQNMLNNGEFWMFAATQCKAGETLRDGETVIFYKQRFVDWINEFITNKGEV